MDAIQLLKSQHDEVKELFEEFQVASEDDEKRAVFEKLADNLAAHAAIEEKYFYPDAYGKELKEVLTEAVEEHLAAKRIIADLLEMEPSDQNFDAKVTVLQEQLYHHIEEEEDELFPKARTLFSKEDLESLGASMEIAFDELIREQPRYQVPSETSGAAPLE
jgi:hypothetical protein